MQASSVLGNALLQNAVPNRRTSLEAKAVYPHAQAEDLNVNEFDIPASWPSCDLNRSVSLQSVFSSTLGSALWDKTQNFSQTGTHIECLCIDDSSNGKDMRLHRVMRWD